MKRLLFLALLTVPRCAPAIDAPDIERLVYAQIIVESHGNDRAIGKAGEIGCLQISDIMLADINRISRKKFTSEDRFDRLKSVEMAWTFYTHYGAQWTVEQAARHWNAGPNKTAGTDGYWNKVRRELK